LRLEFENYCTTALSYVPGVRSDDLVNDGDSAVFVTLVDLLGRGVPEHVVAFQVVLREN
jgi:hypothetical protein